MSATIHPTSIVDPSAHLEDGVRIGPFCVIGPNVSIGAGSELRSHVVIERNTRLGRKNVIFQFVTLGGTPQDRKFRAEETWCEIGDNNQIRESVTIHRGTGNGGGITRIGSDNLIMGGVHVAHDCIIGNRVTIANSALLAGHVVVNDLVGIGGCAGLHHFVSVGRMAFVAGMTRVERDVPPFVVCEGSPARPRTANKILLERLGFQSSTVRALRLGCRRLFSRRSQQLGVSVDERLATLRSDFPGMPEIEEFCASVHQIMTSEKGRVRERHRPDDKRTTTSAAPAV